MYQKFKKFIIKSFYDGFQIEDNLILAVAIFGPFCHLFTYLFHKYVVHLDYTSLAMRLFICFVCLGVYFYKKVSYSFQKKYFPFYWYFVVILALPLQWEFFLLKNNFDEILLYWGIFCLNLTSIFITNWFMVVVGLVVAHILAFGLYYISTPTEQILDLDFTTFNVLGYCTIYVFCTIFGTFFIRANKKTWLLKESRYLKSLAGSIAHEIRNPLNSINVINNQINTILKDIDQDLKDISKANKENNHENKPK